MSEEAFESAVDQAIAQEKAVAAQAQLADLKGLQVEKKIAAITTPVITDEYRTDVLGTVNGALACLGAAVLFADEDAARVVTTAGPLLADPAAALVISWAKGRWAGWFKGGALALMLFEQWTRLKAAKAAKAAEEEKRNPKPAAAALPMPADGVVIFRPPEPAKT